MDPSTEETHNLVQVGDDHLILRRGKNAEPPQPTALIATSPPDGAPMREALCVVAESVLEGSDRFRAALAMLHRGHPAPPLGRAGPRGRSARGRNPRPRPLGAAGAGPGTGKTFRGARMIVAALRRASASASAPRATPRSKTCCTHREARPQSGRHAHGIYKGPGRQPHGLVVACDNDEDTDDAPSSSPGPPGCSHAPRASRSVRPVFIDEAGQFSLANAAAVSLRPPQTCVFARRPPAAAPGHPADHPDGSGASVLEHLLDGASTGARRPRRATHRDLAHAPGRLRRSSPSAATTPGFSSRAACADRRDRRNAGAAQRCWPARALAVRARRAKRRTSREEADAIAAACRDLLAGGTVTDEDRRHAPRSWRGDIMRRRALQPGGPLHPRCGSPAYGSARVDTFQGQRGAGRVLCDDVLGRRGCPRAASTSCSTPTASTSRSRGHSASRSSSCTPAAARRGLQDARADGARGRGVAVPVEMAA